MLRAKSSVSQRTPPQVVGEEVRLVDIPEDIRQLVDDAKLAGLRTHFTKSDVDNSGYIDSGELTAVLRSMGFNPTDKRMSEILSAYDTDRNGNLSFGEFVEVWAYYCQEASQEGELIARAFTFFLPNDVTSMSYSDFKEILTEIGEALTPEEVDRFFSLVDDESDGILRLDEFMKVLYSDQTDLTHLSGIQEKDGVQGLFSRSARPQRRSLMQPHNTHGSKAHSSFRFSSKIANHGDKWQQKSSTGSFLGSETDRSPSKERCQGSRQHRTSRSSRYSRCRSVHVDPGQSARSSRDSSPVRYLRSGTAGPWDPKTLAACQDESGIQEQSPQQELRTQADIGEQTQEEVWSQSDTGEQTQEEEAAQRLIQDTGEKTVAHRVTWAAHNSDDVEVEVGEVDADHLPLILSPKRKAAAAVHDGRGRGQCSNEERTPTQEMNCELGDPGNASVQAGRGEEACHSLPRCDATRTGPTHQIHV